LKIDSGVWIEHTVQSNNAKDDIGEDLIKQIGKQIGIQVGT
jgi:hypothetical protein